MESSAQFEDLPDDILVKIIEHLDPDSKIAFKLANRRCLNLCKRSHKSETVFHIQGNRMNLFNKGLRRLLCEEKRKFKTLRVSKFDLYEIFGDDRRVDSDIQDSEDPLWWFRHDSKSPPSYDAVESVTSLEFYDCVLSDLSFIRLRGLVKNIDNLVISRCCFKGSVISPPIEPKEILLGNGERPIDVTISIPMRSDAADMPERILSHCGRIRSLKFNLSKVSFKRPVLKRYYRKYGVRGALDPHIQRSVSWLSALEKRKDIQSIYDAALKEDHERELREVREIDLMIRNMPQHHINRIVDQVRIDLAPVDSDSDDDFPFG